MLSREKRKGSLHGRLSAEVLHNLFGGSWGIGKGDQTARQGARFMSVGTKAMMKETDRMLENIGYPGGGFSGSHALLR